MAHARGPRGATDFGSFALLGGALAEEMRVRGIATTGRERETWDHEVTAVLLRERLRCTSRLPHVSVVEEGDVYWSKQRAAEAEDYVRDVVYGGAEGLGVREEFGGVRRRELLLQRGAHIYTEAGRPMFTPHSGRADGTRFDRYERRISQQSHQHRNYRRRRARRSWVRHLQSGSSRTSSIRSRMGSTRCYATPP